MTQDMHNRMTIRRDRTNLEFAPGKVRLSSGETPSFLRGNSNFAGLLPKGCKNLRFFYYLACVFLMVMMGMNMWGQTPTPITDVAGLNAMTADGNYIITADINASGFTSSIASFTGTLTAQAKSDGTFPVISNLSVPIFTTATGATISNLMFKSITVSGTGYVGAICGTANGATRIYNCGILPNLDNITRDAKGKVTSYGSTVASTGTANNGAIPSYCGSLVGFLDGTARVINCFSYANITDGSIRAGIVGYNNYPSKYNDLKTMVMNCMFYGDITGGTIYPIYGGANISNDYNTNNSYRLNNYNYFLYEAPFSENGSISTYNCALAAEERFLVRFEYYRHLLNSTRELAAWYATGDAANGRGIGAANKMLKWVLDKSKAPYPILKLQGTYPSVVNYDPNNTYNMTTGAVIARSSVTTRNQGGTIKDNGADQSLTIYVSDTKTNGGQTWPTGASITATYKPGSTGLSRYRTDKDTANYNFNYDKVQLPYYNEVGSGNYTENKVVTGWKIISMGGSGTAGGYSETNYDAPNYNYADRDTYGKDIYSKTATGGNTDGTSGRVFSQGAYFNVPKGVTSITIEPYWGKAAYLSDANYDRYGYNNNDDLTQVGGGRYTNNTDCPVLSGSQKVFTKLKDDDGAIKTFTGVTNPTVYDYALVLVGNYHHHTTTGKSGPELWSDNANTPFTVMSIDLNKDNEPDYCLIYRSGKNQALNPIRFDFITVPGIVMAHKMASHGDLGIPGNCTPKGWFEVTTTGLIKYGQFEHSYNSKSNSPLILMGGVIDQFVANNTVGSNKSDVNYTNKTKYMLFGDNVWFKMLSNGTHMDNKSPSPHRPISLVGGEYETLYLSGYFRPDANAYTTTDGGQNAECYIDGGKFGEVAGAGQENISGSVTWLIDHADIKSFYGGGLKEIKGGSQITGAITTTIKNSHADLFCGGPKFGNMASDMEVNTTATDCFFGTFFGAGYGGTSIYRECPSAYNQYQSKNYDFNSWVSGSYDNSTKASYRGKFTSNKGVACGHEYEFFGGTSGNVARLYLKYASFSLAQTNDVSSELTRCTIKGNFFGGGSYGKVDGDVTSTLTDCTVYGSVFGAGYSASHPKASIMATGGYTPTTPNKHPYYNEATGVYEKGIPPSSTEFEWVHVGSLNDGDQTLENGTIKTTGNLDGLGIVEGKVTVNIEGNTVVMGQIVSESKDASGKVVYNYSYDATQPRGVFGGGDASGVVGDTEVTINADGQQTQYDYNVYNVFGGGNKASVTGNSNVTLKNKSVVNNNVFGGGNEAPVTGSATVNIEQ